MYKSHLYILFEFMVYHSYSIVLSVPTPKVSGLEVICIPPVQPVWHQDNGSTHHLGPLTPASLWALLAPPAEPVRVLEAGWVAAPPSRAGWAG